jgi:hypothetical protein
MQRLPIFVDEALSLTSWRGSAFVISNLDTDMLNATWTEFKPKLRNS